MKYASYEHQTVSFSVMIHSDSMLNTRFCNGLGMDIGRVGSGWNLQNDVRSISHFFTNAVIPDIDMFGVLVVRRVTREINGNLVVFKDWVGLILDTQL